jgi:predicted lipid carrier protein YhbT
MEQALRGARLDGVDAVIRMEVTNGDQVQAWDVVVRKGKATTAVPQGVEPQAVVRVDNVDWLAFISGRASGGELLFAGRLIIEGDDAKVVTVLNHLDGEHQPY